MSIKNDEKSYFQIIRSTSLFGGAQVLNVILGIIRNKLIAIFLGTIGMGLISMYQSTLDLIKSFTSLGIDTTGVREVSIASNDSQKLSRTVSAIHKWTFILACIGALICVGFCAQISQWAFDSYEYASQIAWLSISLFFTVLSVGELVILQGLRQIGYMIKSGLIWNTTALILLTPMYYFYGIEAIVPVFILVSVLTYVCTLYYRRKAGVKIISIPLKEVFSRGKFILRIGFFIVIAAIQTQIALFMVRSMVQNRVGLEQLGLLQAAWTITNVYLKLILNSMSGDFYPRLSAISFDATKIKKLINEQVNVMIIISLPVIVFLMLCSKLLLTILYSESFETAYTLLNWRTIGIFFKVISWGLGFVLLARGKGLLYFISDTSFSVIYLIFIYLLFPSYGLDSVGIAYMIAYISYFFIVYLLLHQSIQFRWTKENIRTGFTSLTFILLTFYVAQYTEYNSILFIIVALLVSSAYAIYKLNKAIPLKEVYHKIIHHEE